MAEMDAWQEEVLAAHNRERALLGIAPLAWNPVLAAHAAQWADHMAATATFQHQVNTGEGENLWTGTAGAYSLADMTAGWIAEKQAFRPGIFPYVAVGETAVGHYTQMIWAGTRTMGCARATGRDWDYLVCRYDPPGNVVGQWVY